MQTVSNGSAIYLMFSHLFHQGLKTPCKKLFFQFSNKETETEKTKVAQRKKLGI